MKILELAEITGKLKKTKRTGWLRYSINDPESVADHSYRVALLAMLLGPKMGVDSEKVVKMALIHDLGEAIIGDIVTVSGNKRLSNITEKLKKERQAMIQILSLTENEKEYLELFDEYEENKTKEAKLVKQLDRVEMAIQAAEYEKDNNINLEEFFQTADAEVSNNYLKSILSAIRKSRNS
jgi:putative hydrolase of HD superfamily